MRTISLIACSMQMFIIVISINRPFHFIGQTFLTKQARNSYDVALSRMRTENILMGVGPCARTCNFFENNVVQFKFMSL